MRQTKTGILLANLGTPDAPTPEAVKRYLKQFLSDRRVVDTSRLLWWPLLRGAGAGATFTGDARGAGNELRLAITGKRRR